MLLFVVFFFVFDPYGIRVTAAFLDGSELTLVSTSGTKPATRRVTLRPKPSSGNMSGRKVSWNEGCEEGIRRSCSSNDNNKTLIKRPCEQRNGQFQHVFGKLERFGPLNVFLHRRAVLNRLILKPWCEKMKTTRIGDVEPFTMVDLQNAVRHMPRNICAHSRELLPYVLSMKSWVAQTLTSCMTIWCWWTFMLNEHLNKHFFQWPISGDYDNLGNWRPLPLRFLNITYYIIFVCVKRTNVWTQFNWVSLLCWCGWCLRIFPKCLFKTYGLEGPDAARKFWVQCLVRIEYDVLFASMEVEEVQGVQGGPHTHFKLVGSLYHDHFGMAQGRPFPIKCCVKWGDVLNPLLVSLNMRWKNGSFALNLAEFIVVMLHCKRTQATQMI